MLVIHYLSQLCLLLVFLKTLDLPRAVRDGVSTLQWTAHQFHVFSFSWLLTLITDEWCFIIK